MSQHRSNKAPPIKDDTQAEPWFVHHKARQRRRNRMARASRKANRPKK
jgi:hypothetical protein